MRKRNISFILQNHYGEQVKQIAVPKSKTFICFCLLGIFLGLGAFIYDYASLRAKANYHHALKLKAIEQFEQIFDQRKDIQLFVLAMKKLKLKLMQLNDLKNTVRKIAKIDKSDVQTQQNELFGAGGAIPDDLNPQISLAEKHDHLIEEMRDQVACIDNALSSQKKKFISLTNGMDDKLIILARTPSIHPCRGRVTSVFGYRKSPFKHNKLTFHQGYDIAAKMGTPIKAAADGVVSFAGYKRDFGQLI